MFETLSNLITAGFKYLNMPLAPEIFHQEILQSMKFEGNGIGVQSLFRKEMKRVDARANYK